MQSQAPLSGGSADSLGNPAKFGVITVSDRASAGIYDDLSGPAILQFFLEAIKSECAPTSLNVLCGVCQAHLSFAYCPGHAIIC